MAEADQAIETEKAGAALDGVEAAKHGVQQLLVVRALFEIDQLFIQFFEDLSGLHQKVLQQFFVVVKGHDRSSEAQARQQVVHFVLARDQIAFSHPGNGRTRRFDIGLLVFARILFFSV